MTWVQWTLFLVIWAVVGTLAARSRRSGVAFDALLGAAATALLVTHAAMVDDLRWVRLLPVVEVWLWSNLAWPGACLLAALAWRRMPSGRLGGQRAWTACVLLALGLWRGPSALLTPPPPLGPERWDRRGDAVVCRQTTNATCGPAAVASALAALGLPGTEASLARAALTTAGGTSDLGLYRALRLSLRGTPHRVVLYAGPPEGLTDFPAVLSIESRAAAAGTLVPVGARHAVALLSRDDDGTVVVADPYSGLQRWTPGQLNGLWSGRVLAVRRDATTR